MVITKAGHEFREMLNNWDCCLFEQSKINAINLMIDGQGFVSFFEFEDNIYGAQETHRVTLAKLMSDDDEALSGWKDEANFLAINLTKALLGKPEQHIFYFNDLGKINIISKKDAMQSLIASATEER